jgi:hypothetical protein
MRSPLPIDLRLIDEFHVGFVDQGGGLERISLRFSSEVLPGQVVQLLIDGRKQPIDGRAIRRFDVA